MLIIYPWDMRMHRPPAGWEISGEQVVLDDEDVIFWVCERV